MEIEVNEELKTILNPSKTAVLVWDVQNMLVNNIFNTEAFLTQTNKIVATARETNIPLFFSKISPLPEKFESSVRKYFWKKRKLNFNQIPNALELTIEPTEKDSVISKNTASIFIGTNFEQIMRNVGITTIVFVGIATEIGIESSARDALNRGFFPIIITDAVSSMNKDAHERSLENLKNMMILLSANDYISILQTSAKN
jgi:nicotinamidase-related amidase